MAASVADEEDDSDLIMSSCAHGVTVVIKMKAGSLFVLLVALAIAVAVVVALILSAINLPTTLTLVSRSVRCCCDQ